MVRPQSFTWHFRVLGLTPSASVNAVVSAFRRLARENHPDINKSPEARRRFIEVVSAYRVLREKMRFHEQDESWGRCRRCERFEALFDAIDGGSACAECLLGRTRLRKLLPAPVIVVAKHASAIALYLIGFALGVLFLQTDEARYAFAGASCTFGGLLLLAFEVVLLTQNEGH